MKQTAVEWLEEQIRKEKYEEDIDWDGLFKQAKQMEKEQKNQMYNETEVLQLLLKLHQTESFDNLKEWFEQNKKTCYHPLTERKHTSDIHFECTICGYNNY